MPVNDTHLLLQKISSQMERLIACQEKRLSGEVIYNFNSAEYVKEKEGNKMLRTLLQKKEQLRGLMAVLWEKREKGEDWTKEERADYDKHSAEVKKLNLDIKERSDYVESFHQNLPADQKEFKSLEKKASVFLILKKRII